MSINNILKGGLIALFFSSNVLSDETPVDMDDLQPMVTQTSTVFTVEPLKGNAVEGYDFSAYCKKKWSTKPEEYRSHKMEDYYKTPSDNGYVSVTCSAVKWRLAPSLEWVETSSKWIKTYNHPYETTEINVCPPPGFVEHQTPVDTDDDGEADSCGKRLERPTCPDGYYKFPVDGECVSIDCAPDGTADTIWGDGGTYSGNKGTYCDGQCAYSVDGGQNETGTGGNFPLKVVSNGAVCGDGTEKWHSDGNENENCATTTVETGAEFVSCTNGNSDNGEPTTDPVNFDELKDEEIGEIESVSEDCDVMDTACEMRNMQEKLDAENLELKTEQQEQHNKQIEAEEKSTTELINAIQELRDFNSIGNEQIVAAIKADTGTGSSGGGTGTVTLDGEGAGLEDSEIGDAFGGLEDKIGEETVSLSNYSAPYSGWISTTACPSAQTTTLTINNITTTLEADHTPMCSFFAFLGQILMAAAYVGVAFMIQRSI